MSTDTSFAGPKDWPDWSASYRSKAKTLMIWEYVDPAQEPPLTVAMRAVYNDDYRRYEFYLEAWKEYMYGIGTLETWVRNHVIRQHREVNCQEECSSGITT
ncbi:hypothetical protein B0T26DRAFT_752739 [Lasiosphaeria miniovina]|uniref:Uncharacterized protein n=1 Tax=Lasiosphaeria miniovina TaxID=1954250 RepID=A0AA40AAY9_9PEZI|nr:uncharacterized protein B0T26DRAFT_752739 [Lasiosphaeria miniovina]KAK0712511.1 hypothetical protein B0T26DRAFT_752739 [Lasiosphaeria miniovina]